MEKVIAVLMRADSNEDWCARQRGPVADALLNLGVPGLSVNVRDDAVRHSLMTLTTLDPPAAAVVSLWTQQCYGEQTTAALTLLSWRPGQKHRERRRSRETPPVSSSTQACPKYRQRAPFPSYFA